MKLSFGQHLSQKQVQTLAPRMIQSMEILQMPLVELNERIEQELRVARVIQQTLLPKEVPQIAGYTISAHWQPARAVSGVKLPSATTYDSANCLATSVTKPLAP